MRNAIMFPALFLAVACGYSEEKYADDYVEKFCAEWADCAPDGSSCPVSNSEAECPEGETCPEFTCDFNADAAKDCIDGAWTCNDEFEGFEFPEGPSACNNVFTNCTEV